MSSIDEKASRLLEQVEVLSRSDATWADFAKAVFAPDGLMAKAFPGSGERAAFLDSLQYQRLQRIFTYFISRTGVVAGSRLTVEYNEPVPDPSFGDLMSVEEFVGCVKGRLFVDDDGIGHPVKDGMMATSIAVQPSRLGKIPADATHIMWFNK